MKIIGKRIDVRKIRTGMTIRIEERRQWLKVTKTYPVSRSGGLTATFREVFVLDALTGFSEGRLNLDLEGLRVYKRVAK